MTIIISIMNLPLRLTVIQMCVLIRACALIMYSLVASPFCNYQGEEGPD